jgi:hypothetical protein
MIGYVMKDFDKPHYSVVSKGVSAQVMITNNSYYYIPFLVVKSSFIIIIVGTN